MLYKLIAFSTASEVRITVVSLGAGDVMKEDIESAGATVIEIGRRRRFHTVRTVIELLRVSRRLRADVIQGWMNHGNVASLLMSLGSPNSALLWNVRQSLDRVAGEKPMTRLFIRAASLFSSLPDAILFNSYVGMRQHAAVGFRNDQMMVIPNGFDTSLFAPSVRAREHARAGWHVEADCFVIGMAARFHPMKNHKGLLEAVARASADLGLFKIILLGTGVEKENRALMELVRGFGLESKCLLLGECRRMETIYPGFDVLCLPSSRAEGFPNVLGEAMACGVPCIASDVGDSADIVGDSGLVVEAQGSEALAHAITRFKMLPSSDREAMSVRARKRILDHNSIERVASKYTEIYQRVARRTPA